MARAETARRMGDDRGALAILMQAVRFAPEASDLYGPLARLLTPMRFESASTAVSEVIEKALQAPWLDPQPLAPAAISALKAIHKVAANPETPIGAGLARDTLLLALLERVLLPDRWLETELTVARRFLLETALDGRTPSDAAARFSAAMAEQSLLNGWMWAETEAETENVARLARDLASADMFGYRHVVLGMYRLLTDLPGVDALAERAKAPWRDAATALVLAPLEEARLAQAMPTIALGDRPETEAVMRQYSDFPYPRWTASPRRRPRSIQETAQALFPHADLPAWPRGRIDVLIAGCGTGKHAADVASRFRSAKVLGVDLSRPALGYAARMLKQAPDVTFAQADIMALGDWERRFDHIESVGVLHHLADPFEGWRILTGLLKPGGSMRVGFYSRRGREHIRTAREAMRAAGFSGETDASLRAARAHILAAPNDDPVTAAAGELDFYAASGARDFLFHAQEAEYRPAELAELVERLGLRVLGLELTDPEAAKLYRARFPNDLAMADLRRWDEIEADAPTIFRHMCQFWVVKCSSASAA